MFEDYFRTAEEAGGLYRVEDLLGVVRTGDSVDDKRFLNRWDATIAGMETPPWFSETCCLGKSENVI